jgi:hypothetical protein
MIDLSRTFVWRKLREQKILRAHRRVAAICETLVAEYDAHPVHFDFSPKHNFSTARIIWQYWAQGYDNVPDVVRKCLDSVDQFAVDYTIVRLTDENLVDYLDIPDFIREKRGKMTTAHYSDLLRLMLLKTYGGIWMDATIMLTGPIPDEYARQDFFVFRRDPKEPNIKYWRNVYAYYFGWAKGFRVNMLNSFIISRKGTEPVASLCDLMLLWWRDHDGLPDYFFFQILYDVFAKSSACLVVSDTLPHYLQQSISDPAFCIMQRDEIEKRISIHKLTYK